MLKNIGYLGIGIDASVDDFGTFIIFAKNNTVSVGTSHADPLGLIARDQIIGMVHVAKGDDGANVPNFGPDQNYRYYNNSMANPQNELIIGGPDDNDLDLTTNPGYITIYFAVLVEEANNISTGVILNMGSGQAVATVETTLTTDGVPANECLRVGDTLAVGDAALIGTVTSVDSATSIKVDAVAEVLADDDEIYVTNPISFNFAFEC